MTNAYAPELPTVLIEEPASRHAPRTKSLSNWAVASVLAGALSAFAALGVVISEYYINPDPPGPVAVGPNAVAVSATPSVPALVPSPVNVAAPAVEHPRRPPSSTPRR